MVPGRPCLLFGILGVVWLLSGVARSLNATTKNAPSYTSSLTVPILEGSVVERDLGGAERNSQVSPRDLRALPYMEYPRTPRWKRKREAKVRAAGHRCQLCNRGSVNLNVHHRTYEKLDGDLTVLCRECHSVFHEQRRLNR